MAAIYAISLDAVSQVKKNGKNYSTEGLDLEIISNHSTPKRDGLKGKPHPQFFLAQNLTKEKQLIHECLWHFII